MAQFNVPEDIGVADFFTNYVPKQFEELTAGVDLSSMAGKVFSLQFNVAGEKYCLNIKDGKELEIVAGGIDKPVLSLAMSEKDWRDSITGKIEAGIDRFTDPAQIADPDLYKNICSTKGTLSLELRKPDGSVMPLTMVFNGESSPTVQMNLDMPDWVAMQKKETNGPALFMGGKLKFQGDMMFLMALQRLL
ncbi:MAG: SCP2 sterol-binding domain-containing protein [Smithellaceae bacterium]|nr:SCP2 sterol-binding domain-containing protein [Smithellaceae bacterium]